MIVRRTVVTREWVKGIGVASDSVPISSSASRQVSHPRATSDSFSVSDVALTRLIETADSISFGDSA